MGKEPRKTGIDVIGDVPWGTHLCQFYQTKEDLIDILAPYFRAGLENNEFCMWVTSEPLGEEAAKEAMRRAVPDFDRFLKRGQMEIVPHTEWYLKDGAFDLQRVLNAWVDKLNQALAKGYDGMRVTGNAAWLEKRDWRSFTDYEEKVNNVIGKYRMLAVCTYSLDRCGASEVIDVVKNHQFALIRRRGKWELIESSERKQAEEELRQSEENLRTYLESAPDGVYLNDLKGTFLYGNKKAEEITGYKREELIGKSFLKLNLLPAKYLAKAGKLLALKAIGRPTGPDEFELVRKDGSRIWVEINTTPIKQKGEGVVIGFARDITERKQAAEALECQEAYFQQLFDNSPDAIAMLDDTDRVVQVNKGFEALFGYRAEEVKGRFINDIVVPADRIEEASALFRAALNGEVSRKETVRKRKDGSLVDVSVLDYPIQFGNKTVGEYAIYTDITERKQAEEEIRTSEERYHHLFENLNDAAFLADAETGRILETNWQGEVLLGRSRNEIVGIHQSALHPPDKTEEYSQKFATHIQKGRAADYDGEVIRKDGAIIPVAISASTLTMRGRRLILGLFHDITERKQAEEREKQLQQELSLTSRLASIGEIASGIAHEINNPLTGVIGFAQLLMRRDLPEDIRKDVEIINDGAQRVASIVSRLLTFARQHKPGREYVNINDAITSVLELRSYEMKVNNIEVVTQLAPHLPRTMADVNQLQQVFLNIVINAEKEMTAAHRRGKLSVKTERINSSIRVSFTDDGPGISKENLHKVFNPFFTTREVGNGTGLGLSICHGIITQHSGRIHAQSELGKGATFVVELPIVAKTGQLEKAEAVQEEPWQCRRAKILVVDDETAILDFLKCLLTEQGYQVETVDRTRAALTRLRRERYDLILLDIKLPGKSGIWLYRYIEAMDPALAHRVLFITGDVMETTTREFLDKTKVRYIAKPLNAEQLKRDINHILTSEPVRQHS